MPFVIKLEFITGLVLGLEYFNEEEDSPFIITIHLLFIRIMIFLNDVIDTDDHNDLGDATP